MLQLIDVRKTYRTADFSQTALDGVSIAFRNNEFAAILGPSGSGKTTLLNIIGGLDHYDSGDLEIEGISTKKYKDPDWDTYRNNRIGFVFQSYNLIPHQSVLANVELALTLSGVSKADRRERAVAALEGVGLGDHINKRPNQLSGGQMQRVAIARALINDPEILLADEPTGALDTKTSTQVMDLLTDIAKNRLVIMVTHNNELVEEYANRVIVLKDGKIKSDSRPFDPKGEKPQSNKNARAAKMSFFTAVSLSFSNLMTKKGRTFVTALAGSIGIIGIAAILALANGINAYIQNIERETMSIYPLTIQKAGFDLSSMFSDPAERMGLDSNSDEADSVHVLDMIETMFSYRSQNDLASLKAYFDENSDILEPYVHTVQYIYDITPQIYLEDISNGVLQVNPDAILDAYGLGANSGMGNIADSFGFSPMNTFNEMPEYRSMFEYQYDVVAGHWPENYDEVVLVLLPSGGISDYMLYGMGLRDRSKLAGMIEAIMENKESKAGETGGESGSVSYEELLSVSFKVVNPAEHYQYDERYNIWVDKSSSEAYMRTLVKNGLSLHIVGIIKPNPNVTATSLPSGINYTPALVTHLMEQSADTEIVQDQLAHPTINVLTGKTFAQENKEIADSEFSFYDLISIDEDLVAKAFNFDTSKIKLDLPGLDSFSLDKEDFDLAGMDMSGMQLPALDISGMGLSDIDLSGMGVPEIDLAAMTQDLTAAVNIPDDALPNVMLEVLTDFLGTVNASDPPAVIAAALEAYLQRQDVQDSISAKLSGLVAPTDLQEQIDVILKNYTEAAMQTYMAQISATVQSQMQAAMMTYMGQVMEVLQVQIATQIKTMAESQLMPQIKTQIEKTMMEAMEQLPQQIQDAISIDQDAFAEAFQLNMDEDEILRVMTALMNPRESTYDRNLSTLGYADQNIPIQIDIYPLDFKSKEEIGNFLDGYNDLMESEGKPDSKVCYTDIVGAMMTSVADIVNMISYALIAFVGISLVVSSIMIGVITYISVLERKKEIGILRAVGASKRDVRHVFNAETLITGFVAGILGIAATQLLCIPANIIVSNNFGIDRIAQLPRSVWHSYWH